MWLNASKTPSPPTRPSRDIPATATDPHLPPPSRRNGYKKLGVKHLKTLHQASNTPDAEFFYFSQQYRLKERLRFTLIRATVSCSNATENAEEMVHLSSGIGNFRKPILFPRSHPLLRSRRRRILLFLPPEVNNKETDNNDKEITQKPKEITKEPKEITKEKTI